MTTALTRSSAPAKIPDPPDSPRPVSPVDLVDLLGGATTAGDKGSQRDTGVPVRHVESPTVFRTDLFERHRGAAVYDRILSSYRETVQSSQLAHHIGRYSEEDDDETEVTDQSLAERAENNRRMVEEFASPSAAADAFVSLFHRKPKFADRPEDETRAKWFRTLMDDPKMRKARATTVGNVLMSDTVSSALLGEYAKYALDLERDPECDNLEQSALEAVDIAVDYAEAAKDVQTALGCGAVTTGGMEVPLEEIRKTTRYALESPTMKKVAKLAGRFTRVIDGMRATTTSREPSEISGVRLGGEIEDLTPSELAAISHPVLRKDALRRLVERQAFCRDMTMPHKDGAGAMMICVDESGSMVSESGDGTRIEQAKGLALALAGVARNQRRWCGLVGFASHCADEKGKTALYENILLCDPAKPTSPEALLEWTGKFDCGGNVADVPFERVPFHHWKEMGAPEGKTDMVLIADGQWDVSNDMRKKFMAWKKDANVRCLAVMIGVKECCFDDLFDNVWYVNELTAAEDGVESLLGEAVNV